MLGGRALVNYETMTAWSRWVGEVGVAGWLLWWCFPGLVFGPSLSGNEDSMSITLFKNLVTGKSQLGRTGGGWLVLGC